MEARAPDAPEELLAPLPEVQPLVLVINGHVYRSKPRARAGLDAAGLADAVAKWNALDQTEERNAIRQLRAAALKRVDRAGHDGSARRVAQRRNDPDAQNRHRGAHNLPLIQCSRPRELFS